MKPTKEQLEQLYLIEKVSPKSIAQTFKVHERTIRDYMMQYGIPRLGPTHLRGGISATWNKGLKRTPESKEKNRISHLGKPAYNFGKGRQKFTCFVCGVDVWDKPYRKKHTCSKECKNKMMSILKGEEHWNYNPENQSIQKRRLWIEYKDWRNAVFKRDNYACQACGKRGCKITAHHKNSYADHPNLRIDVNNGVCLCKECHIDFHNTFGFRNVTESMFIEFTKLKAHILPKC